MVRRFRELVLFFQVEIQFGLDLVSVMCQKFAHDYLHAVAEPLQGSRMSWSFNIFNCFYYTMMMMVMMMI